jgi:hypothetical protein
MSTAIQVRWERGSKKRENWQITTGTAISVRSYSLKRDYSGWILMAHELLLRATVHALRARRVPVSFKGT